MDKRKRMPEHCGFDNPVVFKVEKEKRKGEELEQEENIPNWTCGGIEDCGGIKMPEFLKEENDDEGQDS